MEFHWGRITTFDNWKFQTNLMDRFGDLSVANTFDVLCAGSTWPTRNASLIIYPSDGSYREIHEIPEKDGQGNAACCVSSVRGVSGKHDMTSRGRAVDNGAAHAHLIHLQASSYPCERQRFERNHLAAGHAWADS